MKINLNRQDLLFCIQDLVRAQFGDSTILKSFEFIGKNDEKVLVKRIEVDFHNEK